MVPISPLVAAALRSEAVLGGETIGGRLALLVGQLEGDIDAKETEITVPVSSTAISSIGYSVGGIITVTFNRGGTYSYPGDEELFFEFLMSPSKGQFFNTYFR